VFVVQYDPRLPSITQTVRKHWRSWNTQDPKMMEVFPEPPLVAYKVAPNLRSKLVRAMVPPKTTGSPRRIVPGMSRCGKPNCRICPYILPGKTFHATATRYKVYINAKADCNTTNLCYGICCTVANCGQQYIGQTSKTLERKG
jgi:hypothetical protein